MSRRVLHKSVPRNIPPELEFTSESFDPVKVLAAKSVCLPFPNAKTYNNLAEYYSKTFLKRDDRRGSKEETRERNYAWYYSTMGYDPSLGSEYYADLYRTQNKVKRRKGKKPASTTTTVCENFRANKVVKLKSKYKLYCQRKFNKWRKESSSKQSNVTAANSSDVGDVWTSTTNYAKEFNPASTSVGDFVANLMETSDLKASSTLLPAQNADLLSSVSHADNRKVLLKFDANSDPLPFLKCILFGKVNETDQKSFGSNPNLTRTPTRDIVCVPENQSVPLMPSHIATNVDSCLFLRVELNTVNRNDNSAYETESSGYMSDCSEARRFRRNMTKRLRGRVAAKNHDLNLMESTQSKVVKFNKQTEVSSNRNAVKCKGNSVSCETLPEENMKNDKKLSIIVKIDRKLIKVEHEKRTKSFVIESKSPIGCVCRIKSSSEFCHCTCGFYKKAMNEIRKFKIPRKKSILSGDN